MNDVRDTLSGQAGLLSQLLSQAMGPYLDRAEIGYATFELLSAVRAAGNRASQAEVARRMGVAPATLSEAVKAAVAKGLLEQQPHPRDARAKILRLTPAAQGKLRTILRAVNNAEATMVEGIDPDALSTTIETLRTANRNLARSLRG